MRALWAPDGSNRLSNLFQSPGRWLLKNVITFRELRLWTSVHLEQSDCNASGNTPKITKINKHVKNKIPLKCYKFIYI